MRRPSQIRASGSSGRASASAFASASFASRSLRTSGGSSGAASGWPKTETASTSSRGGGGAGGGADRAQAVRARTKTRLGRFNRRMGGGIVARRPPQPSFFKREVELPLPGERVGEREIGSIEGLFGDPVEVWAESCLV